MKENRKLFWRHHKHPLVVPKDTSIKEMDSFNRIAEDMLLEVEIGEERNSDSKNEMESRTIKLRVKLYSKAEDT